MPNEEWGLVGKVAIVTGGGAADDSIGAAERQLSCWRAQVPKSWLSIVTSRWQIVP